MKPLLTKALQLPPFSLFRGVVIVNQLLQIKESFSQQRYGRQYVSSLLLVLLNVLFTGCILGALVHSDPSFVVVFSFDVLIDAINAFIHFLLFCAIVFIRLKMWIKRLLLLGLLLTQQGMLFNGLADVLTIHAYRVELLGGLLYLAGLIIGGYAVTCWIVISYRHSTLDKLTRVHNRAFFENMIVQCIAQHKRKPQPFCLLNLDLDNFKDINDQHGHQKGDSVLKLVADVLKNGARESDIVCRSGGEEFEVLLLDTSIAQAQHMAERILSELGAATPENMVTLTASIGIAQIETDDTLDSLRLRADKLMYQAKQAGKAQIAIA